MNEETINLVKSLMKAIGIFLLLLLGLCGLYGLGDIIDNTVVVLLGMVIFMLMWYVALFRIGPLLIELLDRILTWLVNNYSKSDLGGIILALICILIFMLLS